MLFWVTLRTVKAIVALIEHFDSANTNILYFAPKI